MNFKMTGGLWLYISWAIIIFVLMTTALLDGLGKHDYKIVTNDNIVVTYTGHCVAHADGFVSCDGISYYGVKEFEEIK